ncbi:MAG TPA: aminoacyl-tRNA hydrolase [Beijerinckiaceae bacterium]
MLLFVGLGNPGAKYARNRHNIGFMALEAIAREHGFQPLRKRFQGLASEGAIDGRRAILLEPQTYMNESGRAVAEAARFHKIPLSDIVVLHDELDLAPGKLRVKTGGGNAGHNGLRSITAQLGNDYRRVRLGIGHPGDKALVHGYVLNDFGKSEQGWVDALCDAVARNAGVLAKGDDAAFQNRVHLAMDAAGYADVKRPGEDRRPT